MKPYLLRLTVAALVLTSHAHSLVAAKTLSLDELFPDKVIAKGRGFEISEKQVDQAYLDYKTAAAANGQQVDEAQRSSLTAKLLDKLIFMKIMLSKATQADRDKGAKRADQLLLQFRKKASSEASFERYLQSLGLTYADFQKKFVDQATVEEVLMRELHSKIEVSEEAMKRFYLDQIDRFKQAEMLRAAHILVANRDMKTNRLYTDKETAQARMRIEGLLKRARSGEDFERLAKEHSEDPGSKARGGTYAFARGQMAVEFEAAAFNLRIGQISDVVETSYGFHVIKLLDRRPAKTVAYEKAQDQIRDMLISAEADKKLPAYTSALHSAHEVVILDDRFRQK